MASTTSSRSRRFALPDLKDERADGVIEAYLDGPKVRKARPRRPAAAKEAVTAPTTAVTVSESPDDTDPVPVAEAAAPAVVHGGRPGDAVSIRTMPGRLAWNDALDRESTRSTRYGRPSAVAIFELRALRPSAAMDSWVRMHATPIGQVLLRMSRATDIVARVADTRFQVLLPETNRDGAGEFAERVAGECQEHFRALGAPLRVDVSVAASSEDTPLHDAVSQAIHSIEAA
jgi:GGDEF domain-containing protein